MRCLVCSMDGQFQGKPCKLCGMYSKRTVQHAGFHFCCDDCVKYFGNIVGKNSDIEIRDILENEVII